MTLRLPIGVSLALNVALGALFLWLGRPRPLPAPPIPPRRPLALTRQTNAPPSPGPIAVANASPVPFHWSQLESDDYHQYRSNLLAVGCPPATVADIVRADLNQLFAHRRHELAAPYQTRFWELAAPPPRKEEVETLNDQLRELGKERQAVLKAVLGPDAEEGEFLHDESPNFEETDELAFLPEEKRSAVKALEARYNERRGQIYRDVQDVVARNAALAQLRGEQRQELAQLLTPAEQEAWLFHRSPTAELVNRQLRGFTPTEAEFRRLYAAQEAIDLQQEQHFAETLKQTEESRRQAREEALRTALGEARYAEYQRETDGKYKDLRAVAGQYQLAEAAIQQAYDLTRQAEQQAETLQQAEFDSPALRKEAFQQLRRATELSLQGVLGEKAYTVYSHEQRGWLDGLLRAK